VRGGLGSVFREGRVGFGFCRWPAAASDTWGTTSKQPWGQDRSRGVPVLLLSRRGWGCGWGHIKHTRRESVCAELLHSTQHLSSSSGCHDSSMHVWHASRSRCRPELLTGAGELGHDGWHLSLCGGECVHSFVHT
jgi:hypothetical protein